MNCMASTSPQSSSPLPSCLEKPLPLDGFQGTPDEVEQQWYDQVYLGSGDRMKQLTWRAVIVGMLLGSILSLTNLYANLKMGWSFGVALTAGIISFALWNAFVRLGISKSPMTILENTCMQSAASSAGYSTGGTLTSAVAALLLLTGQHMPLGTTFAWIFFIAVLGVTMAIPMKRQMINIEQIRFPDSIATAETLKVLYSEGKKAAGQAKALLYSALFAAANAIAMAAGGERWLGTVQQHILGNWYQRTIFFKWDLMFVGAGALVGMKTSLSLFIGGTVCWALYVPWLESQKLLPAGAGYRESVSWTLWGGTACMVVASIVAFLFQWKSIVRSFSSLGAMFSLSKKRKLTDVEKIETPMSWFLTGQLISLGALGYLAHTSFNVPYWMSCIAVVISFFLALVVCRITGEANITPTGAMGKVTQLIFGGIAPGHVTANLMAANITSGASSSSADLLVTPANNSSPSFPEFFWEPSSPCWPSAPWFRMRTLSRLSMLREPEHGRPRRKHWAWGSAICTASRCFPSLQAVFSDSFWCLFPAIFPGQENGSPPPSALAWPGPSSGTTPSSSLQELCSAGLRTIFSRPNHGNIKSPPPPASLQAQPSREWPF